MTKPVEQIARELLAERLREAAEAWRAHVAATEAMNAAIPKLMAPRAERALYDELATKQNHVMREMWNKALDLVKWLAENDVALNRREALEEAAKVAEATELPEGYKWCGLNQRRFKFGAEEAAKAIRALISTPSKEEGRS